MNKQDVILLICSHIWPYQCRKLQLCAGSGKGVSGKPYPRLCNARRPRLEPGTFRSQAVRLYRLHQARPSENSTKGKEITESRRSGQILMNEPWICHSYAVDTTIRVGVPSAESSRSVRGLGRVSVASLTLACAMRGDRDSNPGPSGHRR